MNTIVVGYDETDPARRALDRAATIAQKFQAQLVVTSIAPVTTTSPRGGVTVDPGDTVADHEAELGRALDVLRTAGLDAELVPAVGDPAEAIVELAQSRDADLIVVGSRSVGAVQRLLGQSVSDTVAHHAACDVLIVH